MVPESLKVNRIFFLPKFYSRFILTKSFFKMYRDKSVTENYINYLKTLNPSICPFCKNIDHQVIRELEDFRIVKNFFPYDLWDQCKVLDHIMIIPRRHINGIKELNEKEVKEYFKILSEYEDLQYYTYTRAVSSKLKSVAHLHTHLIRIDDTKRVYKLRFEAGSYLREIEFNN
jgi:ATP adenylyltransferase